MLGAQHGARIDPASSDALRIEKGAAERRGEKLAHRHDPGPEALIDLPAAGDLRSQALQLREKCLEHGARLDAQLSRQIAVGVFDALEPRPVRAGLSRREQRLCPCPLQRGQRWWRIFAGNDGQI